MLDKFRETAITWDKANRKVYEPLRVSAGDNKGRKLSVQVVNGGVIEDLSGASLSLFWETKDKAQKGLDAFTAVDAIKGEFEIYYTTGMLSNEGTLNANLVLVDTSGRVVSEPFTITVFRGIDDDAIQSSDSFTALTEALVKVENVEANYTPRLSTIEQKQVSVEQQLAQITKYIQPTGTGDDTSFINSILYEYEHVTLMKGDYYIDSELGKGLDLPDGSTLVFEKGARLHVIPTESEHYRVLPIVNKKDITIFNPLIVGDLDSRPAIDPSIFQYGLGIAIYHSENIEIYGGHISKTNGSGVSILDSKDIYLERVIASEAYTNGFSIVSGENITLNECQGLGARGTNPEAGLDIEPNTNTELLKNINIINFYSKDCAGAGINVSIDKLSGATTEVSITIDNPIDDGSSYGFWLGRITPSVQGKLTGRININNLIANKNKKTGIIIRNYGADNTPSVVFNQPSIYDANQDENTYIPETSGISFFRGVNEGTPYLMGNVAINQPEIIDTTSKMRFGIFLRDEVGNGFKKFKIIDPIDITGFENLQERFLCDESGLTFSDKFNILTVPAEYINKDRIVSKITNQGLTEQKTVHLQQSNTINNYELTIENVLSGNMVITFPVNTKIFPLSQNDVARMISSEKGSNLKLKKIAFNEYQVIEKIGTWVVEP